MTSEVAMRFLAGHMHESDYPCRLWRGWQQGAVRAEDLPEFLPHAWLYAQTPELTLETCRWVDMFRGAGRIVNPTNLDPPTGLLTVFRGATASRAHGMGWYLERSDAAAILPRHGQYGQTQIYTTVFPGDAVLAFLKRADEGPEIVVDPSELGEVVPVENS